MGCLKLHTEKNYTALKVVYSAVNTSFLEKQEEINKGGFLQVAYRNAQGNGGWVGPANTTNGGIGVLAGAVENLSGNATVLKNITSWLPGKGMHISLSSVGNVLGGGTLIAGTMIDAIGVRNYYKYGANDTNAIHPGKAGLNLGVGAWSLLNPATAIGGAAYYGIDTFYPGGWSAAMNRSAEIQRRDRAILGFYPRD